MGTITITGLTAGGGSYSASYNSASITETANGIVFVAVQYPTAGPFSVPTKSGLTFSTVGSLDFTASSATRHIALYAARAGASPSAGAIAIPATSSAHTRWSIFEATGDVASGDLSSVLGTAVTGQRAGSSPSVALTLTLAALDSADSKVIGAFGNYNYSAATPGSGFTEIHDGNQNNAGLQTEYSTNDTTVDATAVSNYTTHAAVAVEVKAASAGINGSSSTTQGANTAAATGTLAVHGSASTTQGGCTLSATGQLAVQGSSSTTQGDTTVAATGEGAAPISGSATITQGDNTCVATGALAIQGAESGAQAWNALSANGALAIQGGVSISQDDNAVAATGQLPITGVVSVAQGGNAVAATGTGAAGNTGSADTTQDGNALAAVGAVAIIGTLAVQLDDTTVAAAGQITLTGSLAAAQAGHSLTAIGQVPIIGILAVQLDNTTVAAIGQGEVESAAVGRMTSLLSRASIITTTVGRQADVAASIGKQARLTTEVRHV